MEIKLRKEFLYSNRYSNIIFYFRHWSQIPSAERGLSSQLTQFHSPDGTYLASEFNHTVPRQHKGYDTVGYKHYNPHPSAQINPRFFTNISHEHENDKGYYSDRTYESPNVNSNSETLNFSWNPPCKSGWSSQFMLRIANRNANYQIVDKKSLMWTAIFIQLPSNL